MSSIDVARRAFRDGILRDAYTNASALIAGQRDVRVVDISLVIGTRGVILTTNDHAFLRLGLNGQVTLLAWSLAGTINAASAAGTVSLDVRVGSTLATVASICGGAANQPQLTAQAERVDQPVTGWSDKITDSQWLMAIVASTGGTLEVVGLTLRAAVSR